MATFVLVHGAWHGGWCWVRVAERLRAGGHSVFTPTLTGLGERAHLNGPGVDLDTHIEDVVNVLAYEELSDVVLCGHSYGGMVITGVADRAAQRIGALVYLDAMLPADGSCVLDMVTPERRAFIEEHRTSDGVAPVPAAAFGVHDAADAAWVDGKCVVQPYASFAQAIRLTGAHDKVAGKHYILAKEYVGSAFHALADKLRGDPAWRVHELPTGHDVMVTMPDELTILLQEAAA